jgi:hypothetical protein
MVDLGEARAVLNLCAGVTATLFIEVEEASEAKVER